MGGKLRTDLIVCLFFVDKISEKELVYQLKVKLKKIDLDGLSMYEDKN